MPKIQKLLQTLLLALMLTSPSLLAQQAQAIGFGDSLGLSPFWNWKTLETAHFRLNFPEELTSQARLTAQYLEESHALLSERLYWQPARKTEVLVIDNADAANGLTSPVSRFGMVFYLTPPDNWFSTAYYDDWLRLLVIHEYTHFLNMDPTRGVYAGLRVLFGDLLLPNSLWPTWMLEGLAVYMETALTQKGRGRSPLYEMILRTAVENDVLDTSQFITLDKVNGDNPYYPSGETPYLFGYQLMNQVERSSSGANHLGLMSKASSGRVPYFINGNLENISGKDWYQLWNEWVLETRERFSKDLARIKSQPLTPVSYFPETGFSTLGATPSPDGKWLAYTHDSLHQRQGLFLRNLETGKIKRVGDKLLGVRMSFTPDSKMLVYSAAKRQSNYYLFSELAAYDVQNDSTHWLTRFSRSRDPDVSPSGAQIAFTTAEASGVALSLGNLTRRDDELEVSDITPIYRGGKLDRISTPRFSPDGKWIVFTIHRNGQTGEELILLDLATRETQTLLSNGYFNRFPAFDARDQLYFVSDRTGVDNLYRWDTQTKTPIQVTNVTSGVWLPAFGPDHSVYASVFRMEGEKTGWNLAKLELSELPIPSEQVTVTPPPAPEIYTGLTPEPLQDLEIRDYSIFPSLLPRQWAPVLLLQPQSVLLGGQILGYDATDRHQYVLVGAYDTETRQVDSLAVYSNRTLGPTFSFNVNTQTRNLVRTGAVLTSFTRKLEASADVSFPFQMTFSNLTPRLGINAERERRFRGNGEDFSVTAKSRYIPSADFLLAFTDAETSRLAISPERGRRTIAGVRAYSDSGVESFKGLVKDTEYFDLGNHVVLSPSLKGAMTSRTTRSLLSPNVYVTGRAGRVLNSLPADTFDDLYIRGYPQTTFPVKAALVNAVDLRFPVGRIFRGWGTNPVFAENLHGFVFGEATYLPGPSAQSRFLPSTGGGLRLDAELMIHIPLTFSLEYHRGFKQAFGGQGELFFGINTGAISF